MKLTAYFSFLFFPDGCLICGLPLGKGENCFCLHCSDKLPRTNFHLQSENPAEQLFFGKCEIQQAACFCYFTKGGRFRKAVHRFKYNDSPRTAFRLGAFYGAELSETGWHLPFDLIVPVPLHWTKQIRRGYNQSEWIARGLASDWGIPVNTNILRKTQSTTTQTRKSFFDRYVNTRNSFQVNPKSAPTNKHILLVDDVLTSGATLEACAHALLTLPGVKISILTLGFAE